MSPTIAECLEDARQCQLYAARTNDEEDRKFLPQAERQSQNSCCRPRRSDAQPRFPSLMLQSPRRGLFICAAGLVFEPANDLFYCVCVRSFVRSTRMTNVLEQQSTPMTATAPPRLFRTRLVSKARKSPTIAFPGLGRRIASNERGSSVIG